MNRNCDRGRPRSLSGLGTPTFWTIWTVALAGWLASMLVFSGFDLSLSVAVVDRSAAFGKLVALVGELPAWIILVLSVAVLLGGRKEDSRWCHLRSLAWGNLILAVINPLLVTQSLKFLWGRIRFVDLGSALSGYTPFYWPAGPGSGESFPSGHTAMAFILAPLPFFLMRRCGRGAALAGLLVALLYGVPVAAGRVLAGAHFLTDCLFAAGVAFLTAAILMRRLMRTQNS